MSIIEIILLGLALSMDAFAVTMSNAFAYRNADRAHLLLMPVMFGFFQGLMPVIGYFAGSLVNEFISQYAGIITFLILGVIGAKMIWDGFHGDFDEEQTSAKLTFPIIFFQAIATSIDALAVGVSFAALSIDIMVAACIIGVTTFCCCVVALLLKKRLQAVLGDKASIAGGIVLIVIGIKALLP